MAIFNNIIFVCVDNTCQSPVAAAIMKKICRIPDMKIRSRGLICLFPEPYNPKATALLRSNGIVLENGVSKALEEEDFSSDTLVLAMDEDLKGKILSRFPEAQNVRTIIEFAGGDGHIADPYGEDMEGYVKFFESINKWIEIIENKLYTMEEK